MTSTDTKQLVGAGAVITAVVAWLFTKFGAGDAEIDAQSLAIGIAAVIPLVTAAVTTMHAPGWLKSGVNLVVAGLTAVSANIVGLHGAQSWVGVITTFAIAAFAAGGFRNSTYIGDLEKVVSIKTADFGLGQQGAPQRDPDYETPKAA